jgi:hypothetical protein
MSEDTVETRCKEYYNMTLSECFKKFSAGGKMSLRRSQFRLAEKNASMAIWLGKQYLGQKDDKQIDLTTLGKAFTLNYRVEDEEI